MDLLQFVIERYNYWIFIVLMMTGLYTVIARGNLIKKIIGLNIFQTSVFIYYISIGKVAGGTAPIYVPGDMERRSGHHGHGDHGSDHGGGHGEEHHGDAGHHDGHHDEAPLHAGASNDAAHLDKDLTSHADGHGADGVDHAGQHHGEANTHLAPPAGEPVDAGHVEFHVEDAAHGEGVHNGAEAVAEVLYSNPLPHVLILTAIVVGVATTAVGLALAVRIREAYGTIEEDELETADNIAEFGKADPRNGPSSGSSNGSAAQAGAA